MNIRVLIYTITIFIIFQIRCYNKNSENNRPSNIENEYTNFVYIDTLSIKISSNILGHYTKTSLIEKENSIILGGYNYVLHQLDLFDISENKMLDCIVFDKEGVNAIPSLSDFILFEDEIFIENDNRFFIINYEGEILNKCKIVDIKCDKPDYTIGPNIVITNFELPCYNIKTNSILKQIYRNKQKTKPDFYNGYFITQINLDTKNTITYDIKYPKILKNREKFFGDLDKAYFTILGDTLIYNFAFSSKIYLHNIINAKNTEIDIHSQNVNSYTEQINYSDYSDYLRRANHTMNSTRYYSIIYDKYLNKFYRLCSNKIDRNDDFFYKDIFLTILNRKFEKLKEINLKNCWIIIHPTSLGLFIQPKEQDSEDYFTYYLLSTQTKLIVY